MSTRGVRRGRQEEEDESYFISMADMMVGLVFVFLILLLYFALQFRQTTEALAGANKTRREILLKLEKSLKDRGVPVTIDDKSGVLRLPENILFAKGQAELKPEGRQAVAKLAASLAEVLPCYTFPRGAKCAAEPNRIETVLIEGHTDKDAMSAGGAIRDNLDLSVIRATNTYRQLLTPGSSLAAMRNGEEATAQPVFSVSGYGPDRPVPGHGGNSEGDKEKNRRIDLRFIMVTPCVAGMTAQDCPK